MSTQNNRVIVETPYGGTVPFFKSRTPHIFNCAKSGWDPDKREKIYPKDFLLISPLSSLPDVPDLVPRAKTVVVYPEYDISFIGDGGEERSFHDWLRVPEATEREQLENIIRSEGVNVTVGLRKRLWYAGKKPKVMTFHWAMYEDGTPFVLGIRHTYPFDDEKRKFIQAKNALVERLRSQGMSEWDLANTLFKYSATPLPKDEHNAIHIEVTAEISSWRSGAIDKSCIGQFFRDNPVSSVLNRPPFPIFLAQATDKPVSAKWVKTLGSEYQENKDLARLAKRRKERTRPLSPEEFELYEPKLDLSCAEAWKEERALAPEEIWKRLAKGEFPVTKKDFPCGIPRLQQLRAFYIGTQQHQICLWMEIGFGKSKLALDLMMYHRKRGKAKKTLIVVPTKDLLTSWLKQIQQWSRGMRVLAMNDDIVERRRYKSWPEKYQKMVADGELIVKTESGSVSQMKKDAYFARDWDICLMTYASATAFCTSQSEEKKYNKDGEEVPNNQPDDAKIDKFVDGIDNVVYDECTAFKNEDAQRTEVGRRIYDALDEDTPIIGLSGTPITKSSSTNTDLPNAWEVMGQLAAVTGADRDIFKQCFTFKKVNYDGMIRAELIVDPSMYDTLVTEIGKGAVMLSTDEGAKSPDPEAHELAVKTPQEVEDLFDEMLVEADSYEKGGKLVKFGVMSHATLGVKGGMKHYNNVPVEDLIVDTSKLERVGEMIEDEGEHCSNIIVVTRFRAASAAATEVLREYVSRAGRELVTHYGDGGKRWTIPQQLRFENETNQVLVTTEDMLQEGGLNLQSADTMFLLCAPRSPGIYQQVTGRIIRPGQTRTPKIIQVTFTSDRPCFDFIRWAKLFRSKDAIAGMMSCFDFSSGADVNSILDKSEQQQMEWFAKERKKGK